MLLMRDNGKHGFSVSVIIQIDKRRGKKYSLSKDVKTFFVKELRCHIVGYIRN